MEACPAGFALSAYVNPFELRADRVAAGILVAFKSLVGGVRIYVRETIDAQNVHHLLFSLTPPVMCGPGPCIGQAALGAYTLDVGGRLLIPWSALRAYAYRVEDHCSRWWVDMTAAEVRAQRLAARQTATVAQANAAAAAATTATATETAAAAAAAEAAFRAVREAKPQQEIALNTTTLTLAEISARLAAQPSEAAAQPSEAAAQKQAAAPQPSGLPWGWIGLGAFGIGTLVWLLGSKR